MLTENRNIIEVQNVSKHFIVKNNQHLKVLKDISFNVKEGEIVGIVGPSGCGKTTLLRIMCGLLNVSSGTIIFKDKKISRPDSNLNLIFQEYSKTLFPWKTVRGNVAFGIENTNITKSTIKNKINDILNLVGLASFAEEYPWRLSGGMQQRVALARALVCNPSVLLMDEPFGSLDAHTRYILEDEVLALASRLKITIVLVTHDIDEVVYMCDIVLVLSHRPAEIIKSISTQLDKPRDQILTRRNARFAEARSEIHSIIRQFNE